MPFFWDVPIVLGIMFILEVVVLRRNYKIFSPVAMFLVTFTTLYIIPFLGHAYIEPHYRLERLSIRHFETAFSAIRWFFYSWCAVMVVLLLVLSRRPAEVLIPDRAQVKRRLGWVFFFFFIALLLHLGVGVGFNPVTMAHRAINPREYTHVKLGVGPVIHLYQLLRYVVLMLAAALIWHARSKVGPFILFGVISAFTILGGSKMSFVQPLIILVVTWQIMDLHARNAFKKLIYLGVAGFLGVALLLAAFNIFDAGQGYQLGLKDTARRFYGYQKEAYYLPLVIEEFDYSPVYATQALGDSFIAFIPRQVWPGKPRVGFWQRYFRDEFESGTVEYHTTTFGCLCEAHMLFGRAGPAIFGVVWAVICFIVYWCMLRSTSWLRAFVVVIFAAWTYLLMRTGFSGTNFMIMTVYIVAGYLCIRKLVNLRQVQYAQHAQQSPMSQQAS